MPRVALVGGAVLVRCMGYACGAFTHQRARQRQQATRCRCQRRRSEHARGVRSPTHLEPRTAWGGDSSLLFGSIEMPLRTHAARIYAVYIYLQISIPRFVQADQLVARFEQHELDDFFIHWMELRLLNQVRVRVGRV